MSYQESTNNARKGFLLLPFGDGNKPIRFLITCSGFSVIEKATSSPGLNTILVRSRLFVEPILNKIDHRVLIRCKANMYPSTPVITHHDPHVDLEYEHKGAIFYFNTINGVTVLEDGTEIESIENRLLLFDSSKKHNSTSCTDAKVRVNINFNYF